MSVKELSADLELTTIQESEDYINLKKTSLDRTLSAPVDREGEKSESYIPSLYCSHTSYYRVFSYQDIHHTELLEYSTTIRQESHR